MNFEPFGLAQSDVFNISAQASPRKEAPRPGRSQRPKETVTLPLDVDVLTVFKATGRGWEARVNDALRDWLGPPWTS